MEFLPTNNEENIFKLLLKVVELKSPATILRVCGGLIRDRLLGIDCYDIDIAVSDMSGLDFANLVVDYLKENKIYYKNPTVIKANPDQSKHLETAMLEINGLSIDFVNLRRETYAETRIPIIEVGTVEEDAQRRDLTINAIFYNINTGELEDYVGGLEDLANGIAKTPIDPVKTYSDDPLRLYRCIRFATKYNLEVDKNIIYAAQDINVINSLNTKVSSERVFKEIGGYVLSDKSWKDGCFSITHQSSANALELMEKMDLLYILFEDCHINFYKAYYYLINIFSTEFNDSILVSSLAIILYENTTSQIAESLLKIKCPKNIINRVNDLIISAKYLKYHYTTDGMIRKFLRMARNDYSLALNIVEIDCMSKEDFVNVKSKIFENVKKYGWKIKSPITGQDLLDDGFVPGRELGQALGALDDALLENPEMSIDEALKFCDRYKI